LQSHVLRPPKVPRLRINLKIQLPTSIPTYKNPLKSIKFIVILWGVLGEWVGMVRIWPKKPAKMPLKSLKKSFILAVSLGFIVWVCVGARVSDLMA